MGGKPEMGSQLLELSPKKKKSCATLVTLNTIKNTHKQKIKIFKKGEKNGKMTMNISTDCQHVDTFAF